MVRSNFAAEATPDQAGGGLWRPRVGLALAPVAFFAGQSLAGGLETPARRLSGVLAAVAVLWISEAIPLPATALLGAALCVVLGVGSAKQVLAHFAEPIVFVYLGGFFLARAMSVHGLDRRLALGLLSSPWVSQSPLRIMAAMGLATAALSMWVSNTATTAMMLPIALGVLGAVRDARQTRDPADLLNSTSHGKTSTDWPYGAGMMLMVAYAASIGGLATPVGSPTNLIGLGIIRQQLGYDVGFLKWMALALPLVLASGLALLVLLGRLHGEPAVDDAVRGARFLDYVRAQRQSLGPMSRGEANTLLAFLAAIVLWIAPGLLELPWFASRHWAPCREWFQANLPEAIVALLASSLLFLLPIDWRRGRFTLTWHEAEQIDWGTILLFGGGMALGSLMFETGVAEALGKSLATRLGASSLWSLTALAIALAIVLSETASNTASANMVVPAVIAVAQAAGVDPLPPALGACLGASFGFMLPVSTPPNAIVYGSGLIPASAMMRAGVGLDLCGFVVLWVGLRILCPLLNLGG